MHHLAVQRALKLGDLVKETCEVCGIDAVDAQHDQYEDPLTVRWLCRRHHTSLHHYGEDMFPIRCTAPSLSGEFSNQAAKSRKTARTVAGQI